MPKVLERKGYWILNNPVAKLRDVLLVPRDRGWTFNGDFERPTFTPSIKETWQFPDGPEQYNHYIITDGQIHFCSDCTHEAAGQVISCPEIDPDSWPD